MVFMRQPTYLFMKGSDMGNEILSALDSIEAKQNAINSRLFELEQKGSPAPRGEFSTTPNSLGSQFVKAFDQNRDLFSKTKSMRIELKAASDALTTSNGRRIVSGAVGGTGAGLIGLQNGLTMSPAPGTSAIEYSRFTSTQGAAAVQASEGAAKAATRPDFSLITQSALTVAGFTKMYKQALTDSAELKAAIDGHLRRSVNSALDVALTTGGAGFVGGFAGLATAYTSLIYTALADAISEGVAAMQVAGFEPSTVAISPADWLAISVARGTSNDHYLSGSYLGDLPAALRGLNVVLSPTVAAGKALLFDALHCELQVVDQFTVEVGYENSDFTSNLCTILGECRVIPVFRSVGAMRLITPKA